MATFLDLPPELIVVILSYLDVRDLHAIADTCSSLNHVINDQELWKNVFRTRFFADHFSSVSRSRKFSVELFERNEVLKEWRKARSTHRLIPLKTVHTMEVSLQYPLVLAFHDEGSMYISQIDRAKPDINIPVTTSQGSTSVSFDSKNSAFGTNAGQVYIKPLGRKDVWSSAISVKEDHETMVTAIHVGSQFVYSADASGHVMVSDIKTGVVEKHYQLGSIIIAKIQGFKETVVAVDADKIYIINADRRGSIQTINHTAGYEFFEVDFAGKTIVLANRQTIHTYSFDPQWFGSTSTYSTDSSEIITHLVMEKRDSVTSREVKIAGQDGLNVAVVISSTRIITFNIRRSILKPQSEFSPEFKDVPLNNPICSIDVNSSVVLVGSYSGWGFSSYAAVYDVLNGEFIRTVSKKIQKKYLTHGVREYFVPVRFVRLGRNNQRYGILEVNNVVQYFQFGEDPAEQNSKKAKKNLVGVVSERKNKFNKTIKTQVYDMEHDEYQQFIKEEMVDKYNGSDLLNGEDIEVALALDQSMNNHIVSNDDAEIDEQLAQALEMSRLEYESEANVNDQTLDESIKPTSGTDDIPLHEEDEDEDEDEDFKRQLEEAMRRSLYE